MEVKEIKKEITLSFDESDINDLKFICKQYFENTDEYTSNDFKDLANEILAIKL